MTLIPVPNGIRKIRQAESLGYDILLVPEQFMEPFAAVIQGLKD